MRGVEGPGASLGGAGGVAGLWTDHRAQSPKRWEAVRCGSDTVSTRLAHTHREGDMAGNWPTVVYKEEGMREGMQIEDAGIAVDDKVRLLDGRSALRVLDLFVDYARTGALARCLPGASRARVEALEGALHADGGSSPAAVLEPLGVHPIVGDARRLELNSASIDLFVSNSTLEHIPADVLGGILARFGGLASEGAVICWVSGAVPATANSIS